MRADKKTGDQIPKDHRLFQSFEEQSDEGRSDENDTKVLNESWKMSHRTSLMTMAGVEQL